MTARSETLKFLNKIEGGITGKNIKKAEVVSTMLMTLLSGNSKT
jgi:hypothetical protein